MDIDLYGCLGVSPSATTEEIKKAFRSLAKKYHPDTHPGDTAIEAKFKEINEAYAILSDEAKRKEYDLKKKKERETKEQQRQPAGKGKVRQPSYNGKVDFEQMSQSFEQFFGFNPKTQEVTNEEKLKKKNPLDTTDIFEKFMKMK